MLKRRVAVVGAGLLGLAVAVEYAKSGFEVTVLEKESQVSMHQSGRNSGVLHAGPYYRPGSLKAKLCVEGRDMLEQFAQEHGVPFQITGKLIVGTGSASRARLEKIHQRAVDNLVDVEMVSRDRLLELEPNCPADFGLHVRKTGIIDYPAVSIALASKLTNLGGRVLLDSSVESISEDSCGTVVTHSKGEVRASVLINAAGLHSDRVARLSGLRPAVKIVPFRGEYSRLTPSKEHLVNGLIYPVPNPDMPFLGVHLTRAISGEVHVGPTASLALSREAYSMKNHRLKDLLEISLDLSTYLFLSKNTQHAVSELRKLVSKQAIAKEASLLAQGIQASDLISGSSGIRAQAMTRAGVLVDDFVIQTQKNQIHILNAPSPAATSCMAIAKHVVENFSEIV